MRKAAFGLCGALAAATLSGAALAQGAPIAPIEQTALARDAFSTGLIDRSGGALGPELWRGATPDSVAALLEMAPARPSSPAIGAAMRRVLLSPGAAPPGSPDRLGGAKLLALARAGFIDEAREIDSLAAPSPNDPRRAQAMVVADLLSQDTRSACDRSRRVTAGLENAFWVRLRVVCYAASNELDAAELALGILRESGRLTPADEAVLTPLASGGAPKAPQAPTDAVSYAALRLMKSPIGASLLQQADGGVVRALARDAGADWTARIRAAEISAQMGVMNGAELRSLYAEAPASAAPAFAEISAMTAPELMRDRTARIANEIGGADTFGALLAASLLYADETRNAEGVLLPAREAAEIAFSRLVLGDAVGAERWLASASADIARGAPDDQLLRFINIVGVFSVLDPVAANRIAAAANIAVERPLPGASAAAPSADLAPVIAAAIDAAYRDSAGEAALAAIAASGPAARGDPIGEAIVNPSLRAGGLADVARRRDIENAAAALFPGTAASETGAATPVSAPDGMRPRLKPKRSA